MRNLVVFVFDGLQPAMLGPYGNTWISTPTWNQIAANSLLLENFWRDGLSLRQFYEATWHGKPSWNALRKEFATMGGTSQSPSDGRGPDLIRHFSITERKTLLLSDDVSLRDFAGANSFDDSHWLEAETPNECAEEWSDTTLAQFMASSWNHIEDLDPADPFLAWFHCGALGKTWDAPYDYRSHFADEEDPPPPHETQPPSGKVPRGTDPDVLVGWRQAAAGQIRLLDECLGNWMLNWQESPHAANTGILFLSSRGYPLAEHGQWGWSDLLLARELLHGVAMLHLPKDEDEIEKKHSPSKRSERSRSSAFIQPYDLPRTIHDLLHPEAADTVVIESAPRPSIIDPGLSFNPLLYDPATWLRDRIFVLDESAFDKSAAKQSVESDAQKTNPQCGIMTEAWWMHGPLPQVSPPKTSSDEANDTEEQSNLERDTDRNDDQNTENKYQLFARPDDYFGVNNVADRCAEEVVALEKVLIDWQEHIALGDDAPSLSPLPDNLKKSFD